MSQSDDEILCSLVWKLTRTHGWSTRVGINDLASSANVLDERRARDLARDELPDEPFINYHAGKDEIWLVPPPGDDLREFLTDRCGYTDLQVDATISSYLGRS
jgi:hypothetical protein